MFNGRVRPSRTVIAAAVAVAALMSGAGVALAAAAASSSPPRTAANGGTAAALSLSPSWSRCKVKARAHFFPLLKRSFGFPAPPLAFGIGPFGAIHGQFVTAKPGGGYRTIDVQRGKVTAVSASSLTVRSSDGYTKTYQVTSSTGVDARRAGISSVKTGQTVSVVATVHGSTAAATNIVDFASLPNVPKMLPYLPVFPKPAFEHALRIERCVSWSMSR